MGCSAIVYSQESEADGNSDFRLLLTRTLATKLRSASVLSLKVRAAVLTGKMMKTARVRSKPIGWTETSWIDSTIALHKIHNVKGRFGTFIASVLTIMRNRTKFDEWRNMKAAENPADSCCRGVR